LGCLRSPGAIDCGGGIDEATVKRGLVDVGSEEGPPAEGVDSIGRVEAARLPAGPTLVETSKLAAGFAA